jgi:FAD/FMN-containing dehydrogenase/Fe-S oxidoreductase
MPSTLAPTATPTSTLPAPHAEEQLRDLREALAPRLEGEIHTDRVRRALYSTDASLYQQMPLGVVVPKTEGDVQAAVEAARDFGVPVLARGGASSLAGQTTTTGLVIDFTTHLDAITHLDAEARRVRVQPGLVLDRLNARLAREGLMFGPDPASSKRATLGGMVGNNATGTHSILYGNTIAHTEAVRAVLADGSFATFDRANGSWNQRTRRGGHEGAIYRQLDALLAQQGETIQAKTPPHWRRATGYRIEALLNPDERNVAKLLAGSEGTLAVSTEIELALVDRPQRTAVAAVHFHTRREALEATVTILKTKPAAVELFDGEAIRVAKASPGFGSKLAFIQGQPEGILLVEYYGRSEAELENQIDALDAALAASGEGYATVEFYDPVQIADVWLVRSEGLGLLMAVKGDWKPVAFIEDASVPVENLPDYIDELQAALTASDTRVVMYAHASGGCLHVRPFINTKDAAEVEKMRDLAWASMELVRKYGGYTSSEHGDGVARGWLIEPLLGPELYGIYRDVKAIFDPEGRLNPGKIVDTPPMTENLRMGPDYATLPIVEQLDFSADGGFARAAELCNGCGSCRKLDSGTMCPTFMALRDERHTTRGRSNVLRSALSGDLGDPREALGSDEVKEVMELCISCKGCKTECPSGVDMGKLKTEWQAQYWETHSMPLRTRLFAYLPRIARRVRGPLASAANATNRVGPLRKVMDKVLGVAAERPLPPFAAEPFVTWFQKAQKRGDLAPQSKSLGRRVVLFADTFNNFQEPEISKAAALFLARAGYEVVVHRDSPCCGRTFLSKGLVSEAQVEALRTVDALNDYVEEGLPIVGLEPSCILTFTDEFLSLLPGEPRAERLAEQSMLFETFVAREAAAGYLDHLRWKELPKPMTPYSQQSSGDGAGPLPSGVGHVLLHGHCHQKALVGVSDTVSVLKLAGFTVEVVDSGCCGMAGAFGYESEHLELSKAIAERRLAPAVRRAEAATTICAPGTSCRHQIHDTAAREAQHPAQILLDALA